MTRTPVTSSQIASIGHDPGTQKLHVEFHGRPAVDERPAGNGLRARKAQPESPPSVYEYDNVSSEDHAALMAAESHGKHLGTHIKGKYEYRRVS